MLVFYPLSAFFRNFLPKLVNLLAFFPDFLFQFIYFVTFRHGILLGYDPVVDCDGRRGRQGQVAGAELRVPPGRFSDVQPVVGRVHTQQAGGRRVREVGVTDRAGLRLRDDAISGLT